MALRNIQKWIDATYFQPRQGVQLRKERMYSHKFGRANLPVSVMRQKLKTIKTKRLKKKEKSREIMVD